MLPPPLLSLRYYFAAIDAAYAAIAALMLRRFSYATPMPFLHATLFRAASSSL